MKRITMTIAASAVVAVLPTLAAAPAQAVQPSDGCTGGSLLLWVPTLTAEGYEAPAYLDSPTTIIKGIAGNGDNWICALPRGNQQTSWGGQMYGFVDNYRTFGH